VPHTAGKSIQSYCNPEHMASVNEIWFNKVSEPYGWLGNMSPHPVVYEGQEWRTAEALFQALRFNDPQIREVIRTQTSPRGAKMKAKRNDYRPMRVVEPKSEQDLANMRLCLRLKFDAHPELRRRLLATGTALIYEDATERPGERAEFWGARRTERGVEGDNMLGRLLMELRDQYGPR
jgi:ribA/ribD-fused uncharacterized protein